MESKTINSSITRTATIRRDNPEYRSDVDGLRALAITTVLLFHAFPKLCPGGFIGVDIFFVISGFLITGNINRNLESGSFSISRFYLRRVRRIFPALLVVLACCLIAGWFILSRSEFMQLGKNTAAAAGFASNFFYWAESGYFDSAAISKPLLHLWSLGIEEQFYLLWPLLMVVCQRKGKSRELTLAVFSVSFVACVLTTAPLSSGAFYSPATRMWELALGGFLALAGGKRQKRSDGYVAPDSTSSHSWLAELGSLGGIALIAAAAWAFDPATSYPGWRALLPTLGAGLIIAAGKSAFLNRYLLSHPVVVFVGLISYPLYLWHWPLFSFAHSASLGIVSTPLTIALLVASVILATGTYLLLEQPLHRRILSWRLGGGMVATMALLGVGGTAVYASGGAKWSTHSAKDIATFRPLKAPGIGDKAIPTAQSPSHPSLDRESAPPHQQTGGRAQDLAAAAATKMSPPKRDAVAAQPALSRLMLYRRRVSEAANATQGNPDAYLGEMVQSRLRAVRSGICEAPGNSETLDGLKDEAFCGSFVDGAKNILVMGDSIASDTYAWLHIAYPEYNIIQKTGPGCDLQRTDNDNPKPCAPTLMRAREIALSTTKIIDAVVLASLWNTPSRNVLDHAPAGPLIDNLLARGIKVVLIGQPVGFTVPPRDLIDKCPSASRGGLSLEELEKCAREHSTVYREGNNNLKQYAQQKGKGLSYLDVHDLACNDSECPILDDEGQLMYMDNWHRTFPGDAFLARRVRRTHVFNRILDAQDHNFRQLGRAGTSTILAGSRKLRDAPE
jgi:peptidoglycan/LPS O-acetylase OafA/YrhL